MERALPLVLAALLVAVSVFGAGVQPAAAQSDGIGVFSDDDVSELDATISFISNIGDRLAYEAKELTGQANSEDAAQHAQNLQETYNSNSGTLESYVNARVDSDDPLDQWNVVEITVNKDGESATVYLVSDVSNGQYANSQIVDSTSKTVDKEVTLDEYAAVNADDELQYFVDEYAEPDEQLDGDLFGRLGQYKDAISYPDGVMQS